MKFTLNIVPLDRSQRNAMNNHVFLASFLMVAPNIGNDNSFYIRHICHTTKKEIGSV